MPSSAEKRVSDSVDKMEADQRQKCTVGCPILDKTLNGGIPCGSLTEIVGENASAKTQLCLQLLVTVQLPVADGGLNGSSLYIYTENYFPSTRLVELAEAHSTKAREKSRRLLGAKPTGGPLRPLDGNIVEPTKAVEMSPRKVAEKEVKQEQTWKGAVYRSADDVCNNVFVQGVQTAEELLEYLDRAEALLSITFRRLPVRLLVVDSITALFRGDFDNNAGELKGRTRLFFKIASKLKKLAQKYNLAVVISNQVGDYFEPVEAPPRDAVPGSDLKDHGYEVLITSGRRVSPTLGISWAHCVNTRVFLSRVNLDAYTIRRSMQVVFSPHLPNESHDFLVEKNGVRGISPKRKLVDSDCDTERICGSDENAVPARETAK